MDPLLTTLGLELVAGTALDTGKAVLRGLLGWAKGDEVEALFRELDQRFGAVPGLTAVGLAPLRDDPEFLRLLAIFWTTGQFPRGEMVATIERHVGATHDRTPHELAEQVADAIDLYSARARRDEGELFAIEVLRQSLTQQLDALREEVRAAGSVRHVTVEWAPPLARGRLQRLLGESAADLAPLEEALARLDDPRQMVRGLVADPPTWLASGGHTAWDALGEVASGYALWDTASAAFEVAADRPGADRAALLARAAANALLAGDEHRYEALLERAQTLDPNHAQVFLAQLRPGLRPEERLAILDSAPAQEDPRREAALNVARAVARMDLQEWDEAEHLLESVSGSAPDHVALRELGPALVLGRSRVRAAAGRPVDTRSLRAAAAETLELRGELVSSYRYGEAGRLLARAVMALALADEQEQAAALLDQASEEERADQDARRELLEAALAAGKADAAAAFSAPESSDEYEQLLLAQAGVLAGDTVERDKAIEKLEHLLRSEREEIRNEAAFGRQLACLGTDVPPDRNAQRILEEQAPALAAILAANALRQEGRDAEAEALLLRHQDDVRVLRELVRAAGQREQWDRVLELSRALMAREPTPLDRMIFVDAVYRAGGRDEALGELVALRRDEAVPTEIRRDAYAYSARVALDAFDFELLRRVSVEWFEFVPSDKRAAWNYLHALLRLGRSREAISFADEHQIEPEAIDQAELLAAVLDDHPDSEVAARRIGGLSDRFERPERLEGHFLIAALRVHPEDRLEDLREEIQARLASFTDRFPDSQIIRSVPIDTTPEGIDAFFKEHIEPGASHVQETAEKLRAGEVPIAVLAEVVGRPATVTTMQLERSMPLAFGDPVLARLERESAAAAIGRSVVWDPSGLAIVASLPRDVSETIRLAFPGAVVAQATIDDTRRAGDTVSMDRDEYLVMGYDAASDRRFIHERSPEEVQAEREAITRAVEIAQSLQVEPDIDPGSPTQIDELLRGEGDERALAFITWPATLAVAERHHRPIFSDDRFVRVHVRRAGVSSFGTLALLDALHERGMLTAAQRRAARAALRQSGAMGVGATADELLDEARENAWALTRGVAFALLDPMAWTAPLAIETFRIWGELLRAVFVEAPERFELWVLRFVDAAKQNLPRSSYGFIAEGILMIAWQPFAPDGGSFVRALLAALRAARSAFGWFPDPLPGVARRLAAIETGTGNPQVCGVLGRALLRDLDLPDQLALLGIERPW